jgi:hypothetical protein
MGEFTTALLTKLPAMDPPLLASSMLAFSSLKYEPERSLIKAYYMQVCDRILGRHWKGDIKLEEEDLSVGGFDRPLSFSSLRSTPSCLCLTTTTSQAWPRPSLCSNGSSSRTSSQSSFTR